MDMKLKNALRILEGYNGIFRQIYDLGRIHFTDRKDMSTACVEFDKETGKHLRFCFNKKFYDSLNTYQLAFVIAHECMHPLLYHGKRYSTNQKFKDAPEVFNIAADIALHEIMIHEFGFDATQITFPMCTVESVFKEKAQYVRRGATTEYYFDELHKQGCITYIQLDVHNFESGDGEKLEKLMKDAFRKLTKTEQKELCKKLKEAKESQGVQAGNEKGGNWYDVEITEVVKKKWEMVIKEWAQSFLQADKFDWCKPDRRMSGFIKTMSASGRKVFLPSHKELEYKRTTVKLFMDTSGSCINLASRFFSAAASLPPKFFDPQLYCFDTEIYKTDIHSKGVYGGGGTLFHIIEEELSKEPYPDFVFVITDGYGNEVKPKYPEKWHVFLTEDNKTCFPENCVFHSFNEFE